MKITNSTWARTIVLILALANQVLTVSGKNPLPWSETETYEGVSTVLMVGAALVSWWKNNSFTKAAIEADEYKEALKRQEIV